ncbi:hypothetical protein C2E21_6582 [Chlorella sorokiniana]|uniref:Uncharacterized protein n=1 Tax=Chlorella sorokiniana TaxID=3076 RepID=A0A2P6TK12_CHLSO|nr:hypothetical protein C2E21_6582 [Chlorella sorokiniana]|eukprot:PRW44416.1 hypothetical protein C2E21_6582 [Chlorella sorokiniana]
MARSPLPAGEKRWLLRKAGALDSCNPYSERRLAAEGQLQPDSLLQDGRVLQELVRRGDVWLLQASPVGTHDAATRKLLKAYLHSKRIHGGGQGYQTPLLSAAHQKLHEAALAGADSCPQFVLISGKPHWSLLPFCQQALQLGRVAGHSIQPVAKQGRGFVFGCRQFAAAEVRRVRDALAAEARAAAAALQAGQQGQEQQEQQPSPQQAQQAHAQQQRRRRQPQVPEAPQPQQRPDQPPTAQQQQQQQQQLPATQVNNAGLGQQQGEQADQSEPLRPAKRQRLRQPQEQQQQPQAQRQPQAKQQLEARQAHAQPVVQRAAQPPQQQQQQQQQ